VQVDQLNLSGIVER